MSLLAAAAVTVGMHVGSYHVPERGQQNVNPGVYVRMDRWQAGVYRNSFDKTAVYAGYAYPVGPVDLMVGVASGYDKRCTSHTTATVEKVNTKRGFMQKTTYDTTEECEGFSKHKLAPLAAVSYLAPVKVFGASPRVWLMPGIKGHSSVIHLSLEWKQ